MIEKIVNAETGEITERPYTAEEIAESEANAVIAANLTKEAEEKSTARLAILAKLGLSENEIKILFG